MEDCCKDPEEYVNDDMREAPICSPVDRPLRPFCDRMDNEEDDWDTVEDYRAPETHIGPYNQKHWLAKHCSRPGKQFDKRDKKVKNPLQKEGEVKPIIAWGSKCGDDLLDWSES